MYPQSRSEPARRFAVLHPGATLHYAVPAVLEAAGMLQALYTDAHADTPSVRWLRAIPSAVRPGPLRRLLARRIPQTIPTEKIRSWVRPSLQTEWFLRTSKSGRKDARVWHRLGFGGHWLARKAVAENFRDAGGLYVRPCVASDAIFAAKERGVRVVLETTSHPHNVAVQKREYDKHGFRASEEMEFIEENIEFFRREAQASDLVLAASEYVKRGLLELGLEEQRIAVVPYGLDATFYDRPPEPVPGRILYVGMIDPHKGLEYLAEAARILQREGFTGEFRTVGPFVCPDMRGHPAFEGLNYTGPVTRDEVKREFSSADIFVFPTLTDGFGMVLLEALFAKLPIVCTPNCGDVVRDGFNGRVVPTHDGPALARAIREIVTDRARRDEMSRNAGTLIGDFTWEAYRQRLVSAIGSVFAL